MDKKKIFVTCLIMLNALAIPVEAKAVVVTKITDAKATQAYIKQAEELMEIVKQTQQLQSQLENLQQSLQHFDFKDINQSCNFLLDTLGEMEGIQTKIEVLGDDVKSFEEDWEVINKDYENDEVKGEALDQLIEDKKNRRKNNNKRAAMIAGLVNPESTRKSINNVKEYMRIFEKSKTSPVKAMQAVGGILAQQIAEAQKIQKIEAEKLRQEAMKEQEILDSQAQHEASMRVVKENTQKAIEAIGNHKPKYKYPSAVMTKEELMRVKEQE